jgi:hypothetical protein
MRSSALAAVSTAAIVAGLLAGPVAAGTSRPASSGAASTIAASSRVTQRAAAANAAPIAGNSCSPSCDLYATTGTAAMPDGTSLTIWGYSGTNAAGSATLSGPVLVVNQGDPVAITLHNIDLPTATSLAINGQPGTPDTAGVTAGSNKTYSYAAGVLTPGTYLYEAGLTPDGPRQVAMGMYGALIVRPTGCSACDYGASTAFNDEAVLVLSEVDPALNTNPSSFALNDFAPKYWLINGKAYPQTAPIATAAGDTVLLRYVNAGLQHHSMGLLGLHQSIVARDGRPETNATRVVAETVPTGGTLDTLVAIPAAPPANAQWAVYDESNLLANNGALATPANPNPAYTPVAFGGMLTFLSVTGGTGGSTGPTTSGVALAPNPSNGTSPVALTATVSGTPDQAEYFVDALGANGTGCAISGSLTSISVAIPVSGATALCADLTTLTSSNHTFYVQAHDANGWGAPASAVLNLDKKGPAISGLTLLPNPSNGSVNLALGATASDVATGGQNITAAEYNIDGGAATPMTLPGALASTESLTSTISASTVTALAQGAHTVKVRAQDALGNWGPYGTVGLSLDKTGPPASGVSAQPNPNNGTLGVQISSGGAFYVRIDATISELATGASNVTAAEYFVDTVGANGTGGAMIPTDGSFSSTSEAVYAAVDLINIAAMPEGSHTIYVHGRDAAGNWGPTATTTLVIDKTGPATSGVVLNPAVAGSQAVAVSATGTDSVHGGVVSNIGGGELFIDSLGATGTGIQMTAATAATTSTINGTIPGTTIAALSEGTHTVIVRARDAAGNWGTTSTATLTIDHTPPTFSGITLTPNTIIPGTASIALAVNGATDGTGSGVAGGEWWIGTTNITPGTGTAFSGLAATIPTSSLAAGTYTVRVRIRDVAGNWSTGGSGVRTATLTVFVDPIFADGFETGNTSLWTSRSTNTTARLNVTAGAALVGTWGLQAAGSNGNYVQRNFVSTTNTFDARFYFNPNGNASTGQDILQAGNSASGTGFGTTTFRVRYRLNVATPQVQLQVGNTANASWVNLGSGTKYLEVTWTMGGNAVLSINGVLSQTLTANANLVGVVRLGSVTSGGSATLEYFDAFSAKHSTSPLIGP